MAQLEDLKHGASVRGILADRPVTVIDVRWFGDAAVEVTYRDENTGRPESRLLYRSDEDRLTIVEGGQRWSYDGDGDLFRLVSEAQRIRLAYLFDPHLAVSVSQVEPLPHQISAVYEEMLPRQPLRYVLADDPGAGKTIMAGLLIKELLLRGALERCLIVTPAGLAEQWQDELYEKLGLHFALVGRPEIESAVGNPFEERDLLISRIDMLKQDANMDRLGQVDWDLVIVDEAHKMAAHYFSNEVKETARYKLGRLLSSRSRHFLLLTATPHSGKEEDFQLFLALIDGDRFEGRFRDGVHHVDVDDMMRRLMKEDMVDFEGRPLFPERRSYTVNYSLSAQESRLYEEVTRYVREEMSRADALAEAGEGGVKRRTVVGFALTTLQRRLASSPLAIRKSLGNRRRRLEQALSEARVSQRAAGAERIDIGVGIDLRRVDLDELEDELEDLPGEQRGDDDLAAIVDQASAAQTVQELQSEIETLKQLERLAIDLVRSDVDSKWRELNRVIQDDVEIVDPGGRQRKLVIFTEHRDTLEYVAEKIRDTRGHGAEEVATIHGGMLREERRKQQNAFVNDPDVRFLVATDAAGEGINLQRAHLMVNYDLPWNPNRLEQRFGRIHRFGQREVCHCWNLVAHETREGAVFTRLLTKLETERLALGGKVFDVLGQVFRDQPLRDLLIEAVRYGDDEGVRARLNERVDEALSHEHYVQMLDEYALVKDTFDETRLRRIRESVDRAEINRLVPHFIAAFFEGAFKRLGGTIAEREPGRYAIRHVPADVRRRDRMLGRGAPLPRQFTRICFDKDLIHHDQGPPAEFVAPGHPLLDAVTDLVLERYRELLRRGAVLVDERENAGEVRALFFIESTVTDARTTGDGERQAVSRSVYFVEAAKDGSIRDAGAAPYLDYRALRDEERTAADRLRAEPWLGDDLERHVLDFAVTEVLPGPFEELKAQRESQVSKAMAAVKDRLTKEIQYWDHRAVELKEQELAGRKTRLSSGNARDRADDLTRRLQERMADLERQLELALQPPVIAGGALVLPAALLRDDARPVAPGDRRRIEQAAMAAVMEHERRLGNEPLDVSHLNRGYDIESRDREIGRLRLIEVKGRAEGADTVTITRNELHVALNKRSDYFLAIVLVGDGDEPAVEVHYVSDPLGETVRGRPDFGLVSQTYQITKLLELPTAERVGVAGE